MPHPTADRVVRAFAERGIQIRVVEFAESTRTAAEAAAVVGVGVAQIAKSLIFLAGESAVLVIASGINRVSEQKLAARFDRPVRRADAETVRHVTGFAVGGVPPVGHTSPLHVLIDRDLLQCPEVAAGTPHHNFAIAPSDLVRASAGEVADVRQDPPGAAENAPR